jgi:hypothetical protein
MESSDWVYRVFASRHRWVGVVAIVLLCGVLAAAGGFLLAEFGPLVAAAALAALFLGLWMLRDIEVSFWVTLGVVCLLPFASLPFDIGFTPTLLDIALGAIFIVWVLQVATGTSPRLTATPLGLPVAVFMLIAVGAFIVGLAHAPVTPYLLRHFAEVLLSIGLFFLVANTVCDPERLRRIVLALILCAFAAASLGIVLYLIAHYISDDLVIQALSSAIHQGGPRAANAGDLNVRGSKRAWESAQHGTRDQCSAALRSRAPRPTPALACDGAGYGALPGSHAEPWIDRRARRRAGLRRDPALPQAVDMAARSWRAGASYAANADARRAFH